MKYEQKTYEHVWAEWKETSYNTVIEKIVTEKNHNADCTLIDSSPCQATIVFPEGDKIRKVKNAAGFRINGVNAKDFFRSPSKYYPLNK